MTDAFEAEFNRRVRIMAMVRASPYIPFEPTPRQWLFLLEQRPEALFGGAAGGAKSFALLMAALMYVQEPGYHALLLRNSYAQLNKPGALISLANEWLHGTNAVRHDRGEKWSFPSGATLSFGYLATDNDKFNYQGAAYSFVGFDELTQFTESGYTYLFSRMRQSTTQAAGDYPIRARAASNPGGNGADWVKARFLNDTDPTRIFIPSKMDDNPHLDRDSYRQMLSRLDPVTRQQLEHGNWDITAEGNIFAVDNIHILGELDSPVDWRHPRIHRVRAWDIAATASETADYCVALRLAYDPLTKRVAVEDVLRVRQDPGMLEQTMRRAAASDPQGMVQLIEQEPGSSGKVARDHYRHGPFAGYPVQSIRPFRDKVTRARLAASLVANGDVEARPSVWLTDFLNELRVFPQKGMHDDQVDALSHAVQHLVGTAPVAPPVSPNLVRPTGRSPVGGARINRNPTNDHGRRIAT